MSHVNRYKEYGRGSEQTSQLHTETLSHTHMRLEYLIFCPHVHKKSDGRGTRGSAKLCDFINKLVLLDCSTLRVFYFIAHVE